MAKNIEHSFHKTTYTLQTPTYEANITIYTPGQVYVYNSLMAIAAAYFEEIPKQIIQDGLAKMKNIPRSEERRVGKECRSRRSRNHQKKNKMNKETAEE